MADQQLEDRDEAWPVEASADLFRDDWVMALRSDTIRRPDRPETFERLVLEHPGAAIVLALDDEDRVCLLRQYRHAAQRRFVELPAGLCDVEGEEPLEVARRELREEAGLDAGVWTHLTSIWSSPGISAEVMHLYLARELRPAEQPGFEATHEEDEMEVFWAPFGDVLDAVVGGRLTDAPLVVAVLMASARALVGA